MMNYLEEGLTINGAYYAEELRRLHQEIVKKRGKLTPGVLPLQDNAPASTSHCYGYCDSMKLQVHPHPLHSPDLAPSDLICFKIRKQTFLVGILEAMKA